MSTTENLWDEQLLWTKANLYIGEALEQQGSWLFPFWATLSLELLGRAALARIHPTLLADTSGREATNLFYALNVAAKSKPTPPRSIDTSLVFARCKEVIADFTDDDVRFCIAMLSLRNEELHSGGVPFLDLRIQDWLPRYFQCCSILLAFIGKTLPDFVGDEEAEAAEKMIQALMDKTAGEVNRDIAAYKLVWDQKSEDEQVAAADRANDEAKRSEGHVVSCPSCESKALLFGEEVAPLPTQMENDEIVLRRNMLPIAFACIGCGLQIKGHNRLHAAGLGSTFVRTIRMDLVEYYGLEAEYGLEEDFNE